MRVQVSGIRYPVSSVFDFSILRQVFLTNENGELGNFGIDATVKLEVGWKGDNIQSGSMTHSERLASSNRVPAKQKEIQVKE